MSYSLYDLTFRYLDRFYKLEEITGEVKKAVHQNILGFLLNGWTDEDIIKAMDKHEPTNPPDVNNTHIQPKKYDVNLLHPKDFYFHPKLRILPPPPKRIIDYNEGTIKKVDQENFLEMRCSFTLHDLSNYYYKHFEGISSIKDLRKLNGAFNYMLKHYTVEQLLFMIDASSSYVKKFGYQVSAGKEPFFIEDFLAESKLAYEEKRTEAVQAGVDKIVPKKRVLMGRDRSTSSNLS